MSPRKPTPASTKKKLIPLLTFGLSLVLIATGFLLRYHVDPIFTGYTPAPLVSQEAARPVQISFSRDAFVVPVLPATIADGAWELSESTANFLVTSKSPGEGGNIIIYGHNTKPIFAILHRLKKDDEINLKTNLGQEFTYKIGEIMTVNPDQIEVLAPSDHEILTLYTCTGLFDQKRLVVKALPAPSI